jgi:hypothetical protein
VATINIGDMRDRLAKRLNNMPTDDLFYDDLYRYIIEAVQAVPLRKIGRVKTAVTEFPELEADVSAITSSAAGDPSDDPFIQLSNVLAVKSVFSHDGEPPISGSSPLTTLREVQRIDEDRFRELDMTTVGYPRYFAQTQSVISGSEWVTRIKVWPLPSVDYDGCYLTVKALMLPSLVEPYASPDPPFDLIYPVIPLHERWYGVILDYAAHLAAVDIGWDNEAELWLESCDRKLFEMAPMKAQERIGKAFKLRTNWRRY